jgi:hypothetical protein
MNIDAHRFWPGYGEHRNHPYCEYGNGVRLLDAIGSRDGEQYLHVVELRLTDAGRSSSRRPKQRNDCTVRALATVTGLPYDEVYDAVAKAGRKSARGFDLMGWARKGGTLGGFRFVWESYPATPGYPRVNPVTFALKRRTGRYILRVSKHVVACVDGVVYDDHKLNGHRCVYGALKAVPA